jgi:hypothetical protein
MEHDMKIDISFTDSGAIATSDDAAVQVWVDPETTPESIAQVGAKVVYQGECQVGPPVKRLPDKKRSKKEGYGRFF